MKVSNVSLGASEQDIKEFFSFSGDIEYVEMRRSANLDLMSSFSFLYDLFHVHNFEVVFYICVVAMSGLKLHM